MGKLLWYFSVPHPIEFPHWFRVTGQKLKDKFVLIQNLLWNLACNWHEISTTAFWWDKIEWTPLFDHTTEAYRPPSTNMSKDVNCSVLQQFFCLMNLLYWNMEQVFKLYLSCIALAILKDLWSWQKALEYTWLLSPQLSILPCNTDIVLKN